MRLVERVRERERERESIAEFTERFREQRTRWPPSQEGFSQHLAYYEFVRFAIASRIGKILAIFFRIRILL